MKNAPMKIVKRGRDGGEVDVARKAKATATKVADANGTTNGHANGANGAAAADKEKEKKPKLSLDQKMDLVALTYKERKDVEFFGAAILNINMPAPSPIQIASLKTCWPVTVIEIETTQVYVANERDADKERGMGKQYVVPFNVYRTNCSVYPRPAQRAGFTEKSFGYFLELAWRIWPETKSATRSAVYTEKVIVFEHPTAKGNMPENKLYDRVTVGPKNPTGAPEHTLPEPKSMKDVEIKVDTTGLAERGIKVHILDSAEDWKAVSDKVIDKRLDFVMLISCEMSNIQGDPGNANRPRVDPRGYGFALRTCITRKMRDLMVVDGHKVRLVRGSVVGRDAEALLSEMGVETPEIETESTEEPLDDE